MLQATFRGPDGQEISLLDGPGGDLSGWQDTIKDFKSAIASGVSSVGSVIDAANAVGGSVAQTGKKLPGIASGIASTACNIINNSAVQQGATFASRIPNQYAQGAASAAAAGAGICNTAFPPELDTPKPGAPAAPTTPTAKAMPPGSIHWRSSKDGLWHYAIPKAAAKAMGLGAYDIGLMGGLGGFISPWTKPGKFTSPYAMPTLRQLYQRQYNWYDVNTADQPYLATWGLGQSHVEAGAGAEEPPGSTQVSEKAGKDATTSPLWKKWWFWTAVGVGTLAAAGTATYFVRKRS